jgi:hypothetical protein
MQAPDSEWAINRFARPHDTFLSTQVSQVFDCSVYVNGPSGLWASTEACSESGACFELAIAISAPLLKAIDFTWQFIVARLRV